MKTQSRILNQWYIDDIPFMKVVTLARTTLPASRTFVVSVKYLTGDDVEGVQNPIVTREYKSLPEAFQAVGKACRLGF